MLGGRRLDLYKIFQVVAASGGFDEVTKNRGWKQVGDIFKFPSTCTNSAYILKGVYIRNLVKSNDIILLYVVIVSFFVNILISWVGKKKNYGERIGNHRKNY